MQQLAADLELLIEKHLENLEKLEPKSASFKPAPSKWSKKELIGHMIDSAQNNIRRFVVAQYEENPKIIYNQDEWVRINHWQDWETSQLTRLWYLLNLQLCIMWKNMSKEMQERTCETEKINTLRWLGEDYIKHLKHHLHQVLELDDIPYP